jgi:tetratricopeptide (TPR) repeat protein
MKSNAMIYILLALFVGCSTKVVKESNDEASSTYYQKQNQVKLAQQKFIDGSILESKGLIQEALPLYLDALKLDPQPGIYFTIAKNYYKLNKLASAIDHGKKAVQLEPENIEYLYLLASVYSSSRLDDSSAAVYEKIISLSSTEVNALFQLAVIHEKKRPTYSLELYKKVIDKIGPEWNVLVKIAELNERMGNVKETVNTIEAILKLNPSDLRLQKLLIESYIKIDEVEKADKLIDEALASFSDDIGLIEMKASVLLDVGKWKSAYEQYKKLLNNEKINFENKLRVGTIFLSVVEKDSVNLQYAKNIFESLNKDTSDWQVNAYLGEIELRQSNDSIAIQYFKKATDLAEWNSQLWIRLGGLLFDKRKYTQAIKFMSKASEKFPNDFAVNLIYGLSLSQENEHKNAKVYLQRAVRINPSDITALSALGYTLNQLKENEEALGYLNKALALNPNDIQLLGMTALIHDSRENFKMSDSLYIRAMEIDSNNALILNNFSYSLAERNLRLSEALEMSKKAIASEPENPAYLDTIGWIYFKLGDYIKAKSFVEKSIEYDSKSGTVLDHLGDIYFKLGDKKKALEFWQKALKQEPDNKKFLEKIEKGEL